jgi:hypothetical protein
MLNYGPDTDDEDVGAQIRRLWQVKEAEAELPFVQRILSEIRYLVKQSNEMQMHIGLDERISQRVTALRNRGIEIKDLATGLVDFYAVRKGELVYLCWKEGESGIHWWHPVTGGFGTRQKLTVEERSGALNQALGRKGLDQLPGYS